MYRFACFRLLKRIAGRTIKIKLSFRVLCPGGFSLKPPWSLVEMRASERVSVILFRSGATILCPAV